MLTLKAQWNRSLAPEDHRKASVFLANLPRPIILLHTAGNTSPEVKSLPDELVSDLYAELLSSFPGSIVLLDWDGRVPRLPHARVRHIATDWGNTTLSQLAALMQEAALVIGIDSGPYYFASLTKTPALGVFHHHHPSCVALPRPSNVNMARKAWGPVNAARRSKWNIVEYENDLPTAREIALHACRMLAGARYGLTLGRDVMLQQWVRDWCRASLPAFPIMDRNVTFDFLLREMTQRYSAPRIVETGSIRSEEDWKAGYSSYLFGAYLDGRHAGSLTSLDVDPAHSAFAEVATAPWRERTKIICTDSVSWLRSQNQGIDVLYLDSLDTESPEHADHALREVQAAEDSLSANAIVAIDDSPWQSGWIGKGAKAVPYLLERGWGIVASGYQALLSKG